MKYANYDKTTGKLLGWYSPEINGVYIPEVPEVLNMDGTVKTKAIPAHYDISNIPTPNIEVSEADWQTALENGYNFVDATKKTLGKKDFRTFAQLQTAKEQSIKSDLQGYLKSYTLASGTVIKNSIQDQANNLKNIALSQQAMQAGKWVASTDYALNNVTNISGTICLCSTAGKTGTAAPTPPTDFSVAVTDNMAAWKLLGFLVNTDKGRVYFTPQSILEMSQEIALILNEALTKYDKLKAQIKACTTQADLDKIKW